MPHSKQLIDSQFLAKHYDLNEKVLAFLNGLPNFVIRFSIRIKSIRRIADLLSNQFREVCSA